jgi:hypothetical protein
MVDIKIASGPSVSLGMASIEAAIEATGYNETSKRK